MPREFQNRKFLHHTHPTWASDGSLFFITIRANILRGLGLTDPEVAKRILDSISHYEGLGRWHVRHALLMPNHLHAVLAFPVAETMANTVAQWKGYTAKTFKIS